MRLFRNQFTILVLGYLFLFLLGFWFLTKSWLPSGFVLAGHDSGLALDSKQFLESRFLAWDPHINFGQDNALNFGSITLHLFDYVFAILSGNQAAGNQLSIFFWVSLIFCAAVVLSLTLKEYFGRVFVFIFPPLITFNFYVFQSMFMLERAKYGLLAATMIFTALAIRVMEKKMNILFAASLSSLTFLLFNGGSLWGLPLYGGLLIIVIVLFSHSLVFSLLTHDFSQLKKLTTFLILSGIGYVLINSYAIFPSAIKFVRGNSAELFSQESISPNKSWLNYISQSSSFINIFRLQGIPDWYDSQYKVNINHPYANLYATDNFLTAVSFIFPLLAFLSLLLIKTPAQKKLISFFSLLAVVSMIFVAGTHAPLGFIYDFLYDKVPGFAIFRTPFYKFGSAFFLGMIILISFTVSQLIDRAGDSVSKGFGNSRIRIFLIVLLASGVIFSWFAYHKVLLDPEILYWQKSSTTKVKIPEYVYQFKSWVESNAVNGRILLLPPLDDGWKVDSYDWGYWSLSTLPSMLVFKNSVSNDVGLDSEERNWLWEMYNSLKAGKEDEFILLARRLGIGYFLIRNDISTGDKLFNLEEPSKFEGVLRAFNSISPVASFGSWVVFKVKDLNSPEIYSIPSFVEIPQNQLFLYKDFAKTETIFLKKKENKGIVPSEFISTELKSYPCVSCLIEEVETNTVLPAVTVLPNSPLYAIKKLREKADIVSATSDKEKINAYLGSVVRRTGEVKNMLDTRAREKYLLDELKIINDYLLIVHDLVSSNLNSEDEFQQAKRLLQILNPVEANLRVEVDKAKSGTFSEGVIQGMTDVLWQIHRIKVLYSGVLEQQDKWVNEKVFNVTLGPEKTDKMFIGTSFLPFNSGGKRIFPSEAFLTKVGEKFPLKVTPYSQNVAQLEIGKPMEGSFRLSIIFKDVPNKFNFVGFKIVESPRGPIGCYYGNVKRFDKTLNYKIKVQAEGQRQVIKLIVKEDAKDNPQLEYFLKGQRETNIFPILSYEPFVSTYNPSTNLDYISVYVCSENKQMPRISGLTVEEIFSPFVVVARKNNISQNVIPPSIKYTKISPIKYSLEVEGVSSPFILVLNQRYDPLWRINAVDVSPKDTSQDYDHFVINGYANAWKIDKGGKFTIEYSPQKFFYIGLVVSALTFILSLIVVVRNLKKNE